MTKIKLKKRKATKIAYIEHTGDYGSIPFDEYYAKLYKFAKENKLGPGFKPLAIYTNDPKETPPEQLKTEVAIPIYKPGKSGEEVKIRELPEMVVAVLKHAAPAEEYENSYAELGKWVKENGYDWAAPPMEVYTKKPKVKGGKTIIYSEIQAPVKKK